MAGTALLALEPALEHLLKTLFPTMIPTFDDALYAALVSMELIIAALIVVEWRSGRVRAIFPFLLAYFVAIHILATPVASNSSFQRFAMSFAKLEYPQIDHPLTFLILQPHKRRCGDQIRGRAIPRHLATTQEGSRRPA